VFAVRYELNFYILFTIIEMFKVLSKDYKFHY
jgi:hypothetical protein